MNSTSIISKDIKGSILLISTFIFLISLGCVLVSANTLCANSKVSSVVTSSDIKFTPVSQNVDDYSKNTFEVTVENLDSYSKTISYIQYSCRCQNHLGDSSIPGCYAFWPNDNQCKTITKTMTLGSYEKNTLVLETRQYDNMLCGSFQQDITVTSVNGISVNNLVAWSLADLCKDCLLSAKTCECDSDCNDYDSHTIDKCASQDSKSCTKCGNSQDSFNYIDYDNWYQSNSNNNAYIENGKLKCPGTQGDITGSSSGLASKFKLQGDFDVQVNYDSCSQPVSDSYAAAALQVSGGSHHYVLYSHRNADSLFTQNAWTGLPIFNYGGQEETTCSGKFRIQRIGNLMNGYTWSNNNWVLIATDQNADPSDMAVSFYSYNDITSTYGYNPRSPLAYFDNIIINGCKTNQICESKQCVHQEIVCDKDSDCDDSDSHTDDKCMNPGKVDSYCQNKKNYCYDNSDCKSNQYCESEAGECSNKGTCVIKPQLCTDNYNPVCGCDGKTYSNNCFMMLSKVSKLYDGECSHIVCSRDSDCDDSNSSTEDKCHNPETTDSYCTNKPIHCTRNLDCGTDRYIGSPFCQNNDVFESFIAYTCVNPGCSDSYCTDSTSVKLKTDCDDLLQTCSNGLCVNKNIICNNDSQCDDSNSHTVDKCINPGTTSSYCTHTQVCTSNSDCGTNGFVGDLFCQSGNVFGNYITYVCNNPGTLSSSCTNSTAAKLKTDCTCDEKCSNGECIEKDNNNGGGVQIVYQSDNPGYVYDDNSNIKTFTAPTNQTNQTISLTSAKKTNNYYWWWVVLVIGILILLLIILIVLILKSIGGTKHTTHTTVKPVHNQTYY